MQKQRDNFTYRLVFLGAMFTFAANQYCKAYFPYGIILRRAVPTTPLAQLSYYGPMLGFFGYTWYMMKEYPRSQRSDLTCDSEN